jgi:RNA polymerase sigma-70 factor (ECF subfamily)
MSEAPDADAELMLRAQRGDREAFDLLMHRWQQPVLHFIFRTLPDADEAEDLTQAVFVQLWRTAPRYQPSARFSTFLFTIARNLCLNEVRRRSRHPTQPLEAAGPGAEDDGGDGGRERQYPDPRQTAADLGVQQAELVAKIDEALAALPEKQRTALALCREGELSYEEIAEVLGASLQATKSLIHRARETLKGRLKPYLRSGEWTATPPPPRQ